MSTSATFRILTPGNLNVGLKINLTDTPKIPGTTAFINDSLVRTGEGIQNVFLNLAPDVPYTIALQIKNAASEVVYAGNYFLELNASGADSFEIKRGYRGACRTWKSPAANEPQRSIFHSLLDPQLGYGPANAAKIVLAGSHFRFRRSKSDRLLDFGLTAIALPPTTPPYANSRGLVIWSSFNVKPYYQYFLPLFLK